MTTTTKREVPQVTIDVSEPYRVVGYQGGRYGASNWAKRDYTTTVTFGPDDIVKFTNTSKDEIKRAIRAAFYRRTGSDRVQFTFAFGQEG